MDRRASCTRRRADPLSPFSVRSLSEKVVLVLDDANRRSGTGDRSRVGKENPDFELVRYKMGKGLARFMRRGESNLVARDE